MNCLYLEQFAKSSGPRPRLGEAVTEYHTRIRRVGVYESSGLTALWCNMTDYTPIASPDVTGKADLTLTPIRSAEEAATALQLALEDVLPAVFKTGVAPPAVTIIAETPEDGESEDRRVALGITVPQLSSWLYGTGAPVGTVQEGLKISSQATLNHLQQATGIAAGSLELSTADGTTGSARLPRGYYDAGWLPSEQRLLVPVHLPVGGPHPAQSVMDLLICGVRYLVVSEDLGEGFELEPGLFLTNNPQQIGRFLRPAVLSPLGPVERRSLANAC
jgi:hypothetical protein